MDCGPEYFCILRLIHIFMQRKMQQTKFQSWFDRWTIRLTRNRWHFSVDGKWRIYHHWNGQTTIAWLLWAPIHSNTLVRLVSHGNQVRNCGNSDEFPWTKTPDIACRSSAFRSILPFFQRWCENNAFYAHHSYNKLNVTWTFERKSIIAIETHNKCVIDTFQFIKQNLILKAHFLSPE